MRERKCDGVSRALTLQVSISLQGGMPRMGPWGSVGGSNMGMIIGFPKREARVRASRPAGPRSESATVIILPVIRIERAADESGQPANRNHRRRRRRRASQT
jgi:hypothetical protein